MGLFMCVFIMESKCGGALERIQNFIIADEIMSMEQRQQFGQTFGETRAYLMLII